MKVCDRHPDRVARDTVHILADDSRFDLCPECKTELLSFLCREVTEASDKPRRGRPPKNLAQAE